MIAFIVHLLVLGAATLGLPDIKFETTSAQKNAEKDQDKEALHPPIVERGEVIDGGRCLIFSSSILRIASLEKFVLAAYSDGFFNTSWKGIQP